MSIVHRTVMIYGDTLFLKGIADLLHALPGLDVIEKMFGDGGYLFVEIRPDIVLLDASQTSLLQMAQLIESFPTKPCPPFVRLNASEKRLTVHSTQNLPAVTVADMARVIEKICDSVI